MAKSDKPRKQKIRVCQKTKRIIRKSANGKHAKLITFKTHKSEISRKGTNERRINEGAISRKVNMSIQIQR